MIEQKTSVESIIKVPRYGLKLRLDHQYPEKWTPGIRLILKNIRKMFLLIVRLFICYLRENFFGPGYFLEVHQEIAKPIYGVPIGGIGAGSIGRGFRGEFCRYQLQPGYYEYNTVDANQFIVTIKEPSGSTIFQSCLSTFKKTGKALSSWRWSLNASRCTYTGLYPRAWTEYDLSEYGIKLVCRQISPVIPHNYVDSSLPCAVFVWTVKNISDEDRTVTLTFTFKNGTSNTYSKKLCNSKSFTYNGCTGVVLYNMIESTHCAYALLTNTRNDSSASRCLHFDPNSDGSEVWTPLLKNGHFDKLSKHETELKHEGTACAVASKIHVPARQKKSTEFCLVWDMPAVTFPGDPTKTFKRFYTEHFGEDNAFLRIGNHALRTYPEWEKKIYEWQKPVLEDTNLPAWYKTALFNETYFISDGGTIWFSLNDEDKDQKSKSDPRLKYGRFAYLEGHEYRLFNTYDVHFYASFALAMNWPKLQLSIQYDMRDFIFKEVRKEQYYMYDGRVRKRKAKKSVPHDFGDTINGPYTLINSYPLHDVSKWKDLNLQFVLQVFRDMYLLERSGDNAQRIQYLHDMYGTCKVLMKKSLRFDEDNDFLIENNGTPDQTFDVWVMSGPSAYCGGLWLAALFAMIHMSRELGKKDDNVFFDNIFEKAKVVFDENVWNGQYYNFDCSEKNAKVVMANQLCGFWYLRSCGFKYEVFCKNKVVSALNTIYTHNVMGYKNGTMGAVNGYVPQNKKVDDACIQSEEVWTGVTYALVATMMQEKMYSKGWKTGYGMYNTLAHKSGLAFQTPEALFENRSYRSLAYMRPLSIWSIQLAMEQQKTEQNN